MSELNLRKEIIEACIEMNASGLNQGTSGNISAKYGDRMLISPSATPYHKCKPEMVASLPLDSTGEYDGPRKPSTEWRFHLALHASRDDVQAVVHAHPTYCTTLAMARKTIPAAHYMIAAFGGNSVELADYALFGSEKLNRFVLKAMKNRLACLMANHGMCAVGENLEKAMWRATELETIAKQYYHTLLIGGPVLLTNGEVNETAKSFEGYGIQD